MANIVKVENKEMNNLLVLREYNTKLESIANNLRSALDNFGYIGKYLCDIKDKELYKIEGYKDIYELAKDKFDLGSTSTKNFMNVYIKFGDKQYGAISDKFRKYSYSQLVELLPVDEKELETYSPSLPVKEIRLVKKISQMSDSKAVIKEFKQMSDQVRKIIVDSFTECDSVEETSKHDIDALSFTTTYSVKSLGYTKEIVFSVSRRWSNEFCYSINSLGGRPSLYTSEESFSKLLTKFKKEIKEYYSELTKLFDEKMEKKSAPKEVNNCKLKNNKVREEFVKDINNWSLIGKVSELNFKVYKFNTIPGYVMFMYSESLRTYHQVKDGRLSSWDCSSNTIVEKLKDMKY